MRACHDGDDAAFWPDSTIKRVGGGPVHGSLHRQPVHALVTDRDADPVQVSQQTFLGGAETNPTLSPDGQYLAYEAISNDGDSDIFLQRVDGHNPINLTADSPVYDGAPVFSPDGTRIAFRSSREVGGIYVMGATGEDVRRITDLVCWLKITIGHPCSRA